MTGTDARSLLTPAPRRIDVEAATVIVAAATRIESDAAAAPAARLLADRLRLDAAVGVPGEGEVAHSIRLSVEPGPAESYTVDTTGDTLTVVGGDIAGVHRGIAALIQLFPARTLRAAPLTDEPFRLPRVRIQDAPEYRWRGLMIDVARHFLPKRELLRLIDLIAAYRLNTLHLHLTDDQGWRMEIRRYPRLTEVGSWRSATQIVATEQVLERPHGGFYTQDDLREIVAYAAERAITVVPEIDGPGHVQAAVAAYPELGTSSEAVDVYPRWGIAPVLMKIDETSAEFFRNVLDEVMDVFPSAFIGIGADEAFLQPWLDDPETPARLTALGLSEVAEFTPWFVAQLERHVSSRGRRLFGWDEILDGPPTDPDTVVMAWRGEQGVARAAAAGFDVVACPDTFAYLNYCASDHPDEPAPVGVVLDLRTAYSLSPRTPGMDPAHAHHVIGGQANLWTETVDTPRMVDYYLFPRLIAIAEALWSGGGDFDGFLRRLPVQEERLRAAGVEFRQDSGPLPWQQRPDAPGTPLARDVWERAMNELLSDPHSGRPPQLTDE